MHIFQKYAIDLTKQIGIKGPHTAKKLGKQSSCSIFDIQDLYFLAKFNMRFTLIPCYSAYTLKWTFWEKLFYM